MTTEREWWLVFDQIGVILVCNRQNDAINFVKSSSLSNLGVVHVVPAERLEASDHIIKEMQARERNLVADLNEAREALRGMVDLVEVRNPPIDVAPNGVQGRPIDWHSWKERSLAVARVALEAREALREENTIILGKRAAAMVLKYEWFAGDACDRCPECYENSGKHKPDCEWGAICDEARRLG